MGSRRIVLHPQTRKKFQRAVSIVRRQDKNELWKEITFVVFDAPAVAEPFEARLAFVAECLRTGQPPHARAHEHVACTGLDHLRGELARLEALGETMSPPQPPRGGAEGTSP